MPNWCSNEVNLSGDKGDIQRFFQALTKNVTTINEPKSLW